MAGQAVILIMIDGLGIGKESPDNPLTAFSPSVLHFFQGKLGPLPADGLILETRVDGRIPGRPQSATNHTSLLTGINAPAHLGRHLSGFPNPKLRRLLARSSVFRQLLDLSLWPTFANCFMPSFFRQRPPWVSASTVMCESAGIRLRTLADLQQGRGVYMDITNALVKDRGYTAPLLTRGQAAYNLASLTNHCQFVFYEYFLTDIAGHRGSLPEALAVLQALDEFLLALLECLPSHVSLLVTSDHGNLEKLSQRQHTMNPVATLVWGSLKNEFEAAPLDLTDLTPGIVRFLTAHRG